MDITGWTAEAGSAAVRDAELERLPGQALSEMFARSQRLWLKQHRTLSITVTLLMLVFSVGIFGLAVESIFHSYSSSFLPAFFIGWGGLLLVATYVPYSIASSLKVPPEVLLSFRRELLFQKQLAAARRSSGRWLWRITVAPGLLTLLAMLPSLSKHQLTDPFFWLPMGLFMLLPALLHFLARDIALNLLLLRPRRDAGIRLAILYAALIASHAFTIMLPILFGYHTDFLHEYLPGLHAEFVTLIPALSVSLAASGAIATTRHGQRRMPAGYSGGLLPE